MATKEPIVRFYSVVAGQVVESEVSTGAAVELSVNLDTTGAEISNTIATIGAYLKANAPSRVEPVATADGE
jgi:hypothetical protein